MIIYTLVLFLAAAALGFYILRMIVKSKAVRASVVFSHGGIAAAGIILLLICSAKNQDAFCTASLFLFCTAAVLGFVIFFNDMMGKPGPVAVIIAHALTALVGISILLLSFF